MDQFPDQEGLVSGDQCPGGGGDFSQGDTCRITNHKKHYNIIIKWNFKKYLSVHEETDRKG
jgi:hypothetical protein